MSSSGLGDYSFAAVKVRLVFLTLLLLALFQAPAGADTPQGYVETVRVWNEVREKTAPYRQLLQNLYAEVETAQRQDRSRTNVEFSKRLARDYPGSNFGGSYGTLAVNNYTNLSFDSSWNINHLRQRFGSLEKAYDFRNQTIMVADGPNRVALRLDLIRPERTTFTIASIPAITINAEQVWAKRKPASTSPAPLKDLLNDAYAHRIAAIGIRMDQLAEELVTNPAARASVLQAAAEIYATTQMGRAGNVGSLLPNPAGPSNAGLTASSLLAPAIRMLWPLYLLVFLALALRLAFDRTKRRASDRLIRLFWHLWQRRRQTPPEPDYRQEPAGEENWFGEPSPTPRRNEKPEDWSIKVLRSLEWKRFETVCAEYFRLIGYDPRETRIGADGGVDIWVYKAGSDRPVGIVQCKAWTNKVGVKPVRELFGVMAAEGVASGKFMTAGEFTGEAVQFADGKKLQLISGEAFLAGIRKLPPEKQKDLLNLAIEGDYQTPTCPQCGIKMKLREGPTRPFWGCARFPSCKAKLVYAG